LIEAQLERNRDPDAARARLAVLDEAIAADPGCSEAIYYRSQLHKHLGDHHAAMETEARPRDRRRKHRRPARAPHLRDEDALRIDQDCTRSARAHPIPSPPNRIRSRSGCRRWRAYWRSDATAADEVRHFPPSRQKVMSSG